MEGKKKSYRNILNFQVHIELSRPDSTIVQDQGTRIHCKHGFDGM